MARITGSLASVNSVPTEGTVLFRSLELRPGSTFVVTGEPKIAVIKQGKFVIENVEAGPVQITIQGNGVTHDVRVHVPDEAEVDFLDLLGDVYEWEPAQVSAVKLAAREAREAADEAERIAGAFRGAEQLEGWVADASESKDSAAESASAAAASAAAASTSETDAATSAQAASESATAAGDSRDEAGVFAERAEKAAEASEESATESASSAEAAKTSSDTATEAAGRAEKAAEATAKDKEATTKSASAAAADADRAHAEAERAKQIAGGDFAPTEHTHVVKDITDLPKISPTAAPNTIPVREYDTMIRVDAHKLPQYPGHLTNKRYVDNEVTALRGELEALRDTPAFTGPEMHAIRRASGLIMTGATEVDKTVTSSGEVPIDKLAYFVPLHLLKDGRVTITAGGQWKVSLSGGRTTGDGTVSAFYAWPGGEPILIDGVAITTRDPEDASATVKLTDGMSVGVYWDGRTSSKFNYVLKLERVGE